MRSSVPTLGLQTAAPWNIGAFHAWAAFLIPECHVIPNVCHILMFSPSLCACFLCCKFSLSLRHQLSPVCMLLQWIRSENKRWWQSVVVAAVNNLNVSADGQSLWSLTVRGQQSHPKQHLIFTLVLTGLWYFIQNWLTMWLTPKP